jgi:hypothetical protein
MSLSVAGREENASRRPKSARRSKGFWVSIGACGKRRRAAERPIQVMYFGPYWWRLPIEWGAHMRLDLVRLTLEERQQLRRMLNEELRDLIVAGATDIHVEEASPAHDELARLVIRSDVETPSAIVVVKGADPGPESAA